MNDAEDGVSYVSNPSGDVDLITITIRLPPHLQGLPLLRTAAYCARRVIALLLVMRTYRASQKPSE
jgi:hypothetical protein